MAKRTKAELEQFGHRLAETCEKEAHLLRLPVGWKEAFRFGAKIRASCEVCGLGLELGKQAGQQWAVIVKDGDKRSFPGVRIQTTEPEKPK